MKFDKMSPEELQRLADKTKRAHIEAARKDFDAFCSYTILNEDDGQPLRQGWIHKMWTRLRAKHQRLIIVGQVGSGKALWVEEEVPTPTGWTTMGELEPGDIVYDRLGQPTVVEWCSEVQENRTVFTVDFEGGASIRADADHLWVVRSGPEAAELVRTTSFLYFSSRPWWVPLPEQRGVKAIRRIQLEQTVPVRCIGVSSDTKTFLVGRDYTVTHNSVQLTQALPIFTLGRDCRRRMAILSSTTPMAAHSVTAVKRQITGSAEVREVFPDLRPGDPWGNLSFSVQRPAGIRHPSLQALGIGNRIQGARLDDIVGDDIIDDENSRTKAARDESVRWFKKSVLSRTDPLKTRIVLIGNSWHPEDLYMQLGQEPGWALYYFPAVATPEFIAQGLPHPKGRNWKVGEPLWPERWTVQKIAAKREELNNPIEFARQMLCRPRDDSTAVFKEAWIEAALARGAGLPMIHSAQDLITGDNPPIGFFTGVDVSSGREKGDFSAIETIAVWSNGDRRVCEILRGKWDVEELAQNVAGTYARFGGLVGVENVGVQQWLVSILQKHTSVPVIPLNTGKNKADPTMGLQVLAHEVANKKWIFPSVDGRPASAALGHLIDGMLYYSPDPKVHTSDELMACILPGHKVTTSRGLVPIEDVVAGDYVLTHRGRYRKVTGTPTRDWEGEAVRIQPRGLPPVLVTPEHPVYRAPAKFLRDGTNRLTPGEWDWADAEGLRAGRKTAGDYLLAPAVQEDAEKAPPVDPDFAFLVGLYLAEGSAGHHQTHFCLHEDETYLVDFVRAQAQARWRASVSLRTSEGSKGVIATVNSAACTRYFRKFGKRSSKGLPMSWLHLPTDIGLEIVRGWLVGDGSLNHGAHHDALRGVSVAPLLIYQMQQFLWRAGISASVCPFKQSGFFQGKPCGQLPAQILSLSSVGTAYLLQNMRPEEITRWAEVRLTPKRWEATCSVPTADGMATKIADVSRVAYAGKVYNLHVDEDESFVVGCIAVHNCWFASRLAWQSGTGNGEVTLRVIG